jgi:predicted secreted hydrolase
MRAWRAAALLLGLLVLLGALAWRAAARPAAPLAASLSLRETMGARADDALYARAAAPRAFAFPADHGPHPEFRTEWWYFTGNLRAEDGRAFGYQLTFFRQAVAPEEPGAPPRASAWATRQVYLAHFALSDLNGRRFRAFERFARGAAGLAGAELTPAGQLRVHLEDWRAEGGGGAGAVFPLRLRAAEDGVAIDLELEQGKPPVLQGDGGLSAKGPEPGNASYYYSLTRMPTRGTVTVDGRAHEVTGNSWMDREWSTSALPAGVVGWDWFALQLDDGSELMLYQLRRADGTTDPFSKGSLVAPDGSASPVSAAELALEPEGRWRAPSGAVYPARWRLAIPSRGLALEVEPVLADQELPVSIRYWEGAVRVTGTRDGRPVAGAGYLEMTGYAADPAAR